MKDRLFTTAFFVLLSFSAQLLAQDLKTVNTSRSNIKNNRAEETIAVQTQCIVGITSNETGCCIVFTNQVKSPRDVALRLGTGKRTHKSIRFVVSSANNSVSEVNNPRDLATGQASGKLFTS